MQILRYLLLYTFLIGTLLQASTLYPKIQQACSEGNISQCHLLGMKYKHEQKDHIKAVEYLSIACNSKNYKACQVLGSIYTDGRYGIDKNYQEAKIQYKKACDHNFSASCMVMGGFYDGGLKGSEDYKKALAFYEKACQLKNYNGCNALGYAYMFGTLEVQRDYAKALVYYDKACNKKDNDQGFGSCQAKSVSFIEMILKAEKRD